MPIPEWCRTPLGSSFQGHVDVVRLRGLGRVPVIERWMIRSAFSYGFDGPRKPGGRACGIWCCVDLLGPRRPAGQRALACLTDHGRWRRHRDHMPLLLYGRGLDPRAYLLAARLL